MLSEPNKADDCMKILDNGHIVILFRSDMGSYTALALSQEECYQFNDLVESVAEGRITDDFTPSQALYRLTEKFTTGRIT